MPFSLEDHLIVSYKYWDDGYSMKLRRKHTIDTPFITVFLFKHNSFFWESSFDFHPKNPIQIEGNYKFRFIFHNLSGNKIPIKKALTFSNIIL